MRSKFAWIIAGSENYIPGLKAFYNSLEAYGHKEDVILLSWRLPESFLKWIEHLTPFSRVINIKTDDQIQGTAIERFRVAAEIGKEYEAICLLDADMFLVSNCNLFFEIASKDFIVTGSNGMIINFNEAYQKQYSIDLGKPEWPYPKVHTSAPIFISPQDLDWFRTLYDARRVGHFDDFLYLNILGIKMGKDKKMLVMPPYCFTGIHHFGVKPETGWMEKAGLILSGTEEQVYIIHGKWWDEGWRKDLNLTMKRYFHAENMGTKCMQRTRNSIDTGYRKFLEYSRLGS